MIVSNVGVTPGFSSIYTSNSGQNTAFVQASLKENHKVGSYEYMNRVRARLNEGMPELSSYFQSGGLVDAVLNFGLPAPIDVQVSGANLARTDASHSIWPGKFGKSKASTIYSFLKIWITRRCASMSTESVPASWV